MAFYRTILMWTCLAALTVLAPTLFVIWCNIHQIFPGRRLLHVFRRLPWYAQFALAAFVAQLIVYGSTKTNQTSGAEGGMTNAPPMMGASPLMMHCQNLVADVSDSDIARGYQLAGVSTNSGYSYAMPTNGVLCGHGHERGAYEDITLVEFDDWRFMHGSNEVSRLWAFVWGLARVEIRDMSGDIAPVGAPMSAIPRISRLWTAATTNDTRLVTWERFAVGRILRGDFGQVQTNGSRFLDAQIELFPNGDYITRSNEVAKSFRRIDPNDWDGDGWANDEDPDPRCWTDGCFGLEQPLPEGANADAYCWVDVRVPYNTYVQFVGDRESDLPDPSFDARGGETYRVQLLIGKTYTVTAGRPMSIIRRSSPEIEISGEDTTSLSIVYPVDIYALEGNGNGFMMRISPANLGGIFEWTQCCCPITGYGNRFWYAHTGLCACGGCYAEGFYNYEGYSLSCEGGYCGCPWCDTGDPYETHEDDGPHAASASVSFSSPAVIFEDAYTNRPGVVVERQSTRTTLTCTAHGGERGVTATFSIAGDNRLVRISGGMLPVTRFVPPGQELEFEIEYEGCLPSGSEDDIIATARMTGEGVPSTIQTDELTSVKVELRAVYEAPENPNPTRHLYGVGEKVEVEVWPKLTGIELRVDKVDEGDMVTPYDTFAGEEMVSASVSRTYTCPAAGTEPRMSVTFGVVQYDPVVTVIEPQLVVTPDASGEGFFTPGDVVMGDLVTQNYIGPMTVSFRGVKFFEVPCTNAIPPLGYFDTTNFNGNLVHDLDAEAGWIHPIGSGNYWMTDRAGCSEPYNNWSAGRLVWNIPIGWARYSSDADNAARTDHCDYEEYLNPNSRRLLIGNRDDAYLQIYTIEANGTSSVEKFGYKLTRNRWLPFGFVGGVE